MTKRVFLLGYLFVLLGSPTAATAVCSTWYQNAKSDVEKLEGYGSDLSRTALKTLRSDLATHTRLCISDCEGREFEYCNAVAKKHLD